MSKWFAVIYWNYPKVIWKAERLELQLTWYGVLFACGILLEYWLGMKLAFLFYNHRKKKYVSKAIFQQLLEKFALYAIPFIIIGARVAYILFYGGNFYFRHPSEIFKIWHGGLASHGGILGLLLWITFFVKRYQKQVPYFTFLFLCDLCCAVFGWGAFLIRIGNFINQEIIGKATSLPWGVIFSSPVQGTIGVAVHPVQLYEGFAYLVLTSILYCLNYRRKLVLGSGVTTVLVLISVSCIRFIAEFFKSHQGNVLSKDCLLSMGQILSLPLLIFGMVLGWYVLSYKKKF